MKAQKTKDSKTSLEKEQNSKLPSLNIKISYSVTAIKRDGTGAWVEKTD